MQQWTTVRSERENPIYRSEPSPTELGWPDATLVYTFFAKCFCLCCVACQECSSKANHLARRWNVSYKYKILNVNTISMHPAASSGRPLPPPPPHMIIFQLPANEIELWDGMKRADQTKSKTKNGLHGRTCIASTFIGPRLVSNETSRPDEIYSVPTAIWGPGRSLFEA